MNEQPDSVLASRWLAAAIDPEVSGELEGIYAQISSAIAARSPVCWSSGRCCNFEQTGHRLYVTGLEAAYTLARLPAPLRIDAAGIDAARRRGGCPFQSANLCGVHAIKPLGCRIYFCDRSTHAWQQELSERMLGEIRALHDHHLIEYRYAEWRWLLESIAPLIPSRAVEGPTPEPRPASGGISLPVLRARHES